MLIDSIAATMLLAADDVSFLASLLASIGGWTKVAFGIGFVIFVHELGHFAAAKTFGVKCEKFYVGFDPPIKIGPIKFPRTFGKITYGETEYGIGIIPLGGYVKMLGQDDDPRKMEEENERIRGETGDEDAEAQLDPRSFPAQPVWQRMIIISAGVVMNVITGVIFAAVAFGFGVPFTPAIVGSVTPGGPAWQAGVQPGGQVVSVSEFEADEMHFRDMQTEILHAGLEHPEDPVDLAIRYSDGPHHFTLPTQQRPDLAIVRMVGISPPNSTNFSKSGYAEPDSAAASVLTELDAGASIVAFDGIPIDSDAIVPTTPLLHHLYTNPTKPITLTLKRADNTEHTIELPPQKAKSIGLRFTIGPIVSLVKDGPAEQAGMQVGDQIIRVGDNQKPDAFGLAIDLVGATESVPITVQRDGKEVELLINPTESLQTSPPTDGITGEIAINSVGFAYHPLTTIGAIVSPLEQPERYEPLQVGDTIEKVKLIAKAGTEIDDPRLEKILAELNKGWTFDAIKPLRTLREAISVMPEGTELEVNATRPPEGTVITSMVKIVPDDQYLFRRGIGLLPSKAVQTANSVTDAFALGAEQGKRKFDEVLRFLGNLVKGKISLSHVGGPVAIAGIAKSEADRGLPSLLMFLTFLSMNLAILNFLPIPALDGGHMVFLFYELVAGKRANEQLEFRLTVAGLLTLLMLMVVVFANDIMRAMG
jgi:regulator of sigma E protease